MSALRKVYVDTRFALRGAPSDFYYDLGEDIPLSKNTICYVSEWTGPASWDNIHPGCNKLYLIENPKDAVFKMRIITFEPGVYDRNGLAAILQEKLRAGKHAEQGTYTVAVAVTSNVVTAAGQKYLKITLEGGGKFRIIPGEDWTENNMYEVWKDLDENAPDADVSNLRSISPVLQWRPHEFVFDLFSTFIDLRSRQCLFLHSPSFGDYTSIGPRGVRTALIKIPIVEPLGNMVHVATNGLEHDYVTVSSRTLRLLRFQLRDAFGELVDMKGGHYSFTLIFAERAM